MSTIFIPKEVILGIITTYSVITASLFLGGPIVAAMCLIIYAIPSNERFWLFLKAICCFVLWFILVLTVNAIEGTQLLSGSVF